MLTRVGLSPHLQAWMKLANLSAQTVYAYRLNVLLQLVALLLQIFLLRMVWTAVYADRGQVDGVALASLLTYLTIANLQIWFIHQAEGAQLFQQRVREGVIALDLARPVGLAGQLVAQQVGFTVGLVPLLLLSVPFAFVVGTLQAPPSLEALGAYALSLVLAYGVVILLGLILAMVAFWTFETGAVWAIYRFVNLFFAGGLVPLWFFPGPLRTVAEFLPFQTQAFIPVSIYLGRLAGADAARSLAVQALWVVLLGIAARAMWSRAMRRVAIQGG